VPDPDNERSLQDLVLDYAVYAPVGIVITVVEELPELTAKGRERLRRQIRSARVIGKLAVGEAHRRIAQVASQAGASGASPPARPGRSGGLDDSSAGDSEASVAGAVMPTERLNGGRPNQTTPGPIRAPKADRGSPRRPRASKEAVEAPEGAPPVEGASAPSVVTNAGDLAIPGYDTLAASQVVQRLSSLRPDELDAIRLYELGTRGRRTILHRIAQLSGGNSPASPAIG
jgi:hypothetical protein